MRRTKITLAGLALSAAAALPAMADFKVQMPDAETGEIAVEPIGDIGHDPLPAHSGELSSVQEFEYGVNGFWRTELELEQDRDAGPGQSIQFSQVTAENVFQFTERGQYWVDAGFFVEFGRTTLAHTPNETTFGPIFRKEFFDTINTVNLFMSTMSAPIPRRPARVSLRLGDADRARHADRARFPGLWPAERLSRIQFRLAAGQPHRPAAVRHDQQSSGPAPSIGTAGCCSASGRGRRARPGAGRPNTKSISERRPIAKAIRRCGRA